MKVGSHSLAAPSVPTDIHGKLDLPEGRGSEEEACICDPPTLKAHLTQGIQILRQHPGTPLLSQMSVPQLGRCFCDVVYFIFLFCLFSLSLWILILPAAFFSSPYSVYQTTHRIPNLLLCLLCIRHCKEPATVLYLSSFSGLPSLVFKS